MFFFILGLFVYFYYGIKHSTLEPTADEDERIELKMKSHSKPQSRSQPPPPPPSQPPATATAAAKQYSAASAVSAPVASTVDEKTEPKRPTNLEPIPANGQEKPLFVSPSAFPKWDD